MGIPRLERSNSHFISKDLTHIKHITSKRKDSVSNISVLRHLSFSERPFYISCNTISNHSISHIPQGTKLVEVFFLYMIQDLFRDLIPIFKQVVSSTFKLLWLRFDFPHSFSDLTNLATDTKLDNVPPPQNG